MFRDNILDIKPSLYFAFAFSLLLFPIRWLIGWLIAVIVHEACHLIALVFCKAKVYRITLDVTGARIYTHNLTPIQEFCSCLAGPIGSFLLATSMCKYPYLALCAFIQGLFNFIPIYPMDGGRALGCALRYFLGKTKGDKACFYFGVVFAVALFVLTLFLTFRFHFGLIPIALAFVVLFRAGVPEKVLAKVGDR